MDSYAPKTESYIPAPEFRYSPTQQQIDFAQLVASGADIVEALPLSGLITHQEAVSTARPRLYALATRQLSLPSVQERLDFYRQLHQASMAVTVNRIQQELAAQAFADPADLFNEDGTPRYNIRSIPRHARAAIKKWTVDKDNILKFELHDKNKALKMLGDVAGMFNEAYEAQAPTVEISLSPSEALTAPTVDDPAGGQAALPRTGQDPVEGLPECLR